MDFNRHGGAGSQDTGGTNPAAERKSKVGGGEKVTRTGGKKIQIKQDTTN